MHCPPAMRLRDASLGGGYFFWILAAIYSHPGLIILTIFLLQITIVSDYYCEPKTKELFRKD